MTDWQPIETAPIHAFDPKEWFMSGQRVLLWDGVVTIGSYSYTKRGKGRWQNWHGTVNPTHWMPLPEAPK